MPIRIGTENIGDIYVGTERIGEVYVGTELVYQRVQLQPFAFSDWTGSPAVARSGAISFTLGNAVSVTNTPSQSFGLVGSSTTRTVNCRVEVPAGFSNSGGFVDGTRTATQPATTVSGNFVYGAVANTSRSGGSGSYSVPYNTNASTGNFTLTAAAGYQFADGRTSVTLSYSVRRTSSGNVSVPVSTLLNTATGGSAPSLITYTATMNWAVANFANSDRLTLDYTSATRQGTMGQAYDFTTGSPAGDPGSSVHVDYQLQGPVTFSGDSLTGTFGTSNVSLNRTASTSIIARTYTQSVQFEEGTATGINLSGTLDPEISGTVGDSFSVSISVVADSGFTNPVINSVSSSGIPSTASVTTNGTTVTYSGTVPSGGFSGDATITINASATFTPTCSNVDGSGTAAALSGPTATAANCFGTTPGCETVWTSNTGWFWVDSNPGGIAFINSFASGTSLCYAINAQDVRVGPALSNASGLKQAGQTAESVSSEFCTGATYSVGNC